MNTNEAKQIRIEEYLHSLGYDPVRRQGGNLWYKSPFRDEREPSFKVNTERNLWYDFGAGRGGNIIALAQELYASDSLPYLLERIAEQAPGVHPVSFSFGKQTPLKTEFPTVGGGAALFPRLVFLSAAEGDKYGAGKKRMQGSALSDRRQTILCRRLPQPFGEATRYATSSSRGASHRRTSPTYGRNSRGRPAASSRGFMDYLSFLTLRLERCPERPDLDGQDYIVLNSTSNLSKAIRPLDGYGRIHCFLDNDKAGMEAVQELREEYGLRVRDASHIYRRLQRPERLPLW